MILADSRYQTSVLITVDAGETTRQEMRVALPTGREVSYTFYRTDSGDRPDLLADDFLGDPNLWWVIADINPEVMDWTELPVGTVIRVPNG